MFVIGKIKQLRQERRELAQQIRNTDNDYDLWHDLNILFGENMDDENIELAILSREIDEAYFSQPFAKIRKQGKERFWDMVDNYLNS